MDYPPPDLPDEFELGETHASPSDDPTVSVIAMLILGAVTVAAVVLFMVFQP